MEWIRLLMKSLDALILLTFDDPTSEQYNSSILLLRPTMYISYKTTFKGTMKTSMLLFDRLFAV